MTDEYWGPVDVLKRLYDAVGYDYDPDVIAEMREFCKQAPPALVRGCVCAIETFPKFNFIEKFGENEVYEIQMPDGNRFRYSWGQMIPYANNKKPIAGRCGSDEQTCQTANQGQAH